MSDEPYAGPLPLPSEGGEGGAHRWTLPTGWLQGRGIYGGVLMAGLVAAMRSRCADPEQRLRSITAVIPAAVQSGEAEVPVAERRAGSNTTTLEARVVQAGEVRAQATAIFGRERDPELTWADLEPPDLPPWRDIEPMPYLGPPIPEFLEHLAIRVASGAVFSGAAERVTSGWIGYRAPVARLTDLDLVALIDGWWGACLATFTEPRPAGTVAFTAQLLGDAAELDASQPLAFRGSTPASHSGYTMDFRELWSPDGRLLALNQQTLVIIK